MKSAGAFLVLFGLVISTALLFVEVPSYDFINLDDPYLVQNNADLLKPLSTKILLEPVAGLYHPLTNFSFWLEAQSAGLEPGVFHTTNLIFHLLGLSGLFLFVIALSGSLWSAGFLAAAFAWHPTHVESVVWISERKDVLSVAFFWWALFAHVKGWRTWALVLAVLSLLAKPFAMVLPLIVLAIEFYQRPSLTSLKNWCQKNKVYLSALLILCSLAAVLSVFSQTQVRTTGDTSTWDRLLRVPQQLLFYGSQSLWPTDLKLIYSSEDLLSRSVGTAIFVVFLLLSGEMARRSLSFRRDLIFGWGLFLITLAPLLKLVPFGDESPVSDRYLYVSQTGLFWPWALQLGPTHVFSNVGRALTGLVLVIWMHGTWTRLPAWENSLQMWQSLLAVEPDSKDAYENLGRYYIGLEKPELALSHLQRGYTEKSDNLQNQAFALLRLGRIQEAGVPLSQAEKLTPEDPRFLNLKGNWLMESGDLEGAEKYFSKSLAAGSKLLSELVRAEALTNLGVLAFRRSDFSKCLELQNEALRSLPAYAYAYHNRALCFLNLNRMDEAQADYETTLRLSPGFAMAHNGLGVLALKRGDIEAAIRHFENAVAADPRLEMAKNNLRNAQARKIGR